MLPSRVQWNAGLHINSKGRAIHYHSKLSSQTHISWACAHCIFTGTLMFTTARISNTCSKIGPTQSTQNELSVTEGSLLPRARILIHNRCKCLVNHAVKCLSVTIVKWSSAFVGNLNVQGTGETICLHTHKHRS